MERQTETKGKEIVLLCLSLFAYLISNHRMKMQQLKCWNERLCWGSIQHSHKQIRQEIPWVWFCWCFLPQWETHSLPLESKQTSSVRTTPLIFLKPINKAFLNRTPQHWAQSRGFSSFLHRDWLFSMALCALSLWKINTLIKKNNLPAIYLEQDHLQLCHLCCSLHWSPGNCHRC